jgi:hypothetical protein
MALFAGLLGCGVKVRTPPSIYVGFPGQTFARNIVEVRCPRTIGGPHRQVALAAVSESHRRSTPLHSGSRPASGFSGDRLHSAA